jgi:hypothetical protein
LLDESDESDESGMVLLKGFTDSSWFILGGSVIDRAVMGLYSQNFPLSGTHRSLGLSEGRGTACSSGQGASHS